MSTHSEFVVTEWLVYFADSSTSFPTLRRADPEESFLVPLVIETPQRPQSLCRIGRSASLFCAMISLLLMALPLPSAASPGAYADPTAFSVAAGMTGLVDFEDQHPGSTVSGATFLVSGSSLQITLPGPIPDVLDPGGPALDLQIVANGGDNPASSGTRSLGVVDAKNFDAIASGSAISFTFSPPVSAFGLTIVTPEEPNIALLDGDVRLDVSGEAQATLSLAAANDLGVHGGRNYRAYFLGVIGASTFSTASLSYIPGTSASSFFYNIDDLIVPEPAMAGQLLAGVLGLSAFARRRARVPLRKDAQ